MAESIITRRKSLTGGGEAPGNYSTWVVEDENGAKYEVLSNVNTGVYNGANTYEFNRWILNNDAAGDVVLNNTTMITGSFLGNNTMFNQANLIFINNTTSSLDFVRSITINNGFIYAVGNRDEDEGSGVMKYHENNLEFVGSSANYGVDSILSVKTNNGFIYIGGETVRTVRKYREDNLATVGNTGSYGGDIYTIAINNGFVYVGGNTPSTVRRYNESTLTFINNTANYGGRITSIAINNGFIYAAGLTANVVRKYHESNLTLVGNTATYGNNILSIAINNGFIYVGGGTLTGTNRGVAKYYEDNLALVGANLNLSSTANYGGIILSITTNNGFIYAGGQSNTTVQKFNESTLAFVGNAANYDSSIINIDINNSFIYSTQSNIIRKFQEIEVIPETYYSINKVKVGS
jgi:hypothetical protein